MSEEGASDEVKSFHDEGDGEENMHLQSLAELKQDLEEEADTEKAKQPSTPKVVGSSSSNIAQNGTATAAIQLPIFPKMTYPNGQPVQFMFPGLPGLMHNGTFPAAAATTATMPGTIKMEFPPNGAAISATPGMVLPGYAAANLAMAHAYPYMLAGQYMMPQVLPMAGSNGCSPNVIMSQQGLIQQPAKEKKPHIKKPLNAFMLFMKEKRQEVIKECTLKESAAINQILGKMWHQLDKTEQAKYYELARQERTKHMQMYPGWSARDNYALHKKRKRRKVQKEDEELVASGSNPPPPLMMGASPTADLSVSSEELIDPNGRKCRARFGTEQRHMWCDPCRRKKRCVKFSEDEDEDNEGSPPPQGGVTTPVTSVDQTPKDGGLLPSADTWREGTTVVTNASYSVAKCEATEETSPSTSSDNKADVITTSHTSLPPETDSS